MKFRPRNIMTNQSNIVSRRTALKGIAGLAGTAVAGAGMTFQASEPAAATGHAVEIDDITIELSAEDGEAVGLTEFGLSDMWFEVEWENIETSVWTQMTFINDSAGVLATKLGEVDLGVDGDGTETFGFGTTYESSYDVDLAGPSYLDGATPLQVQPSNPNGQAFLDELRLGESESEKTVEIRHNHVLRLAYEDGSIDGASGVLENKSSYFNVTLQRVSPNAEVSGDGEADAYGDS